MSEAVRLSSLSIVREVGSSTHQVAIADLDLGHTVRSKGLDDEHVRMLANSDSPLPAVMVHRPTMRVVDGLHRVRAAVLRGESHVEAKYFDGSERDALVLALRLNSQHGLPLSRADRVVAAERMVAMHPDWSDRAIATLVGTAAKTVSEARCRVVALLPEVQTRLGRDGRVRPLNAATGREIAGRLFAERPTAGLREIAREAGISVGTARDVRLRMSRGDDLVPSGRRASSGSGTDPVQIVEASLPMPQLEFRKLLGTLTQDPSLRLSETGRRLLRLLDAHSMTDAEWGRLVKGVPPHANDLTADLAKVCAEWWRRFASVLDSQVADTR